MWTCSGQKQHVKASVRGAKTPSPMKWSTSLVRKWIFLSILWRAAWTSWKTTRRFWDQIEHLHAVIGCFLLYVRYLTITIIKKKMVNYTRSTPMGSWVRVNNWREHSGRQKNESHTHASVLSGFIYVRWGYLRLTGTFAHSSREFTVADVRSWLNCFTCLPEARLRLSEEAAEFNLNWKTQLITSSPGLVFLSLWVTHLATTGHRQLPVVGVARVFSIIQCQREIYYQVIQYCK